LRSCLIPLGTGVKLAVIFLAAIIASFMTEGMTPIPCYMTFPKIFIITLLKYNYL